MNFPEELLNNILSFRPSHPIAELLKDSIKDWIWQRNYNVKHKKRYYNTQYFYKYHLRKYVEKIEKLKKQIKDDDFYFRCCKEDRLSTEQAVKLKYESKQRKQRLNKKLEELNIKPWEISTGSSLRHLIAFHNGIEIFNESKMI